MPKGPTDFVQNVKNAQSLGQKNAIKKKAINYVVKWRINASAITNTEFLLNGLRGNEEKKNKDRSKTPGNLFAIGLSMELFIY